MGLIRKVASVMMLGGMSSQTRREPPGKERARADAERAEEEAAQALEKAEQAQAEQAQAERAEAEAEVAGEQAAAIAGTLRKDEARRQAELKEVAEKEAEAVPDWPPDP